jgi:phage tail-like protein
MPPVRTDPYPAHNFLFEIDGIAKGSFTEVSASIPRLSIDVIEYRDGDAPENTPRKLVGLRKFTNIILKRGYTSDESLWSWYDSVAQGNLQRANGSIILLDEQRNPVLVWKFKRGWPCKYEGPHLNAKTSEVAIETLEICHEGLELAGLLLFPGKHHACESRQKLDARSDPDPYVIVDFVFDRGPLYRDSHGKPSTISRTCNTSVHLVPSCGQQ